jgi:ABC-type bacteriocin/lantibiotic exporter with double-glycine peptidase domain
MVEFSGTHNLLRQEGAETPPDVSYRFVVSPGTLRAAEAAARAFRQKRKSWWQRAIAAFLHSMLRVILGALISVLLVWLSLQPVFIIDHALDATQRSPLLPIAIFLVAFIGLLAGFRFAIRRLVRLHLDRIYREFYSDNEFLVEGRKSHLWFDERSAGAIRRWSTFEKIVEFEEGMWLFLRRGRTFADLRGILISKNSLPNSCAWNELQTYLSQRLAEGAK